MTFAAEKLGDAADSLELRRARLDIAAAADVLSAVCRDPRAPAEAVTAADDLVCRAFAHFGSLMLAAAALRVTR
jgi:hypothetical protein